MVCWLTLQILAASPVVKTVFMTLVHSFDSEHVLYEPETDVLSWESLDKRSFLRVVATPWIASPLFDPLTSPEIVSSDRN